MTSEVKVLVPGVSEASQLLHFQRGSKLFVSVAFEKDNNALESYREAKWNEEKEEGSEQVRMTRVLDFDNSFDHDQLSLKFKPGVLLVTAVLKKPRFLQVEKLE
jgi:hypothetical protein